MNRKQAGGRDLSEHTQQQYQQVMQRCRKLFFDKMKDYGTAWRVLRSSSLTDQIFIKANRIRTLQEGKTQQIEEGIGPEFTGVVNYSLMALIQLGHANKASHELSDEQAGKLYDDYFAEARDLMARKNHDYGEAWRDMRISSITDLILMKLLRIRQIEDNAGATRVSEGVDAGYYDIVNYAVFALVKLGEGSETKSKS